MVTELGKADTHAPLNPLVYDPLSVLLINRAKCSVGRLMSNRGYRLCATVQESIEEQR